MKQLILLIIVGLTTSFLTAQQYQDSWELSTPISGNKIYVASKYIALKPGFSYSATGANKFIARIGEGIATVDLTEHQYSQGEIKLYPNPTKGQLILSINNGEENKLYSIKLYNMAGQQILEKHRRGNGSFNINIERHPSGTYILILSMIDGNIHYKITKT